MWCLVEVRLHAVSGGNLLFGLPFRHYRPISPCSTPACPLPPNPPALHPSVPPPLPSHHHQHRPFPPKQVNYREGISRNAEVRYVHKKQSGGSGQFADVAIRFEPGEPGTGFEFRRQAKRKGASVWECVGCSFALSWFSVLLSLPVCCKRDF